MVMGQYSAGKPHILAQLKDLVRSKEVAFEENTVSDLPLLMDEVYKDDAMGGYGHYHPWYTEKTGGHDYTQHAPNGTFTIINNDIVDSMHKSYFETLSKLPSTGKLWLAEISGGENTNFQPGATEEELQAVETALGVVFPEDVKASYRIHNGKMVIGDPDQRLRKLCSLQEMVHTWEMMKKYAFGEKVQIADDWLTWDGQPIRVRAETWNVKWIPLLEGEDGDLFCLDLAPTPHGQMGQIIESDVENGPSHRWLAPSWQAFLSTFADDLGAGEYCYEEGALTWS